MTVTASSETTDGILGKFLDLSGSVAPATVAAEKAHDRVTGTTTSEQGQSRRQLSSSVVVGRPRAAQGRGPR
ncbi:hypothetical protein [Streptomyces cadmiisoli]|uniref:hypothetical protein n=1 Tax=Streptomyces cadmiisoli TaxID=2184053 RepID=UPI0036630750